MSTENMNPFSSGKLSEMTQDKNLSEIADYVFSYNSPIDEKMPTINDFSLDQWIAISDEHFQRTCIEPINRKVTRDILKTLSFGLIKS